MRWRGAFRKRPTLNPPPQAYGATGAERPISNSDSEFGIQRWELDVGRFPRNGLTLQPLTSFLWQITLSTASVASGATSFAPCRKNKWSRFARLTISLIRTHLL